MKHSSEAPRPPREFVTSIPAPLEEVVLHALEKRPEDRPANAAEFRRELLATAERLGLEHGGLATAPDLDALRNAGTESPSGRLVIDLSRLRENRAATSGASEITVISQSRAAEISKQPDDLLSADSELRATGQSFPRVSVPVNQTIERAKQKPLALLGLILVLVVLGSVGFFTVRSWGTATPATENVVASPSPTPSPKLRPLLPDTCTNPKTRREAVNANKKKGSKVGSAIKKFGRILKKPF